MYRIAFLVDQTIRLYYLILEHDYLSVNVQINPQFYAFRWITLLLTQEFNFADCLHIWDTLLSDPEGPQVRNVLAIAPIFQQFPRNLGRKKYKNNVIK